MKLLVANNAAPFVRGGAELLAERLVTELVAAGHEAELLRLPLGETSSEIADGMVAAATLDVVNVDRVIALKFPAYLIPHRDVVVWLIPLYRSRRAATSGEIAWMRVARRSAAASAPRTRSASARSSSWPSQPPAGARSYTCRYWWISQTTTSRWGIR